MTADYRRYLAERVLNEQEHVTYRALSRALKVHSDHAKRMLYDFHRVENAKKPKSVHATYVIVGTPEQPVKRAANGTHPPGDGDEIMQSSPFTSSQVARPDEVEDTIPVTEVRLVREEALADAKSQFKNIFSIFMYSLQSTSPQDLNTLADLGHTILESQPEDPLECGPRYGMIQNENVKRQTRAGPPPTAAPPPATAEKSKAAKPSTVSQPVKQEPAAPKEEQESQTKPTQSAPAKSQTQSKPTGGASQSKRDNASIFKAFAKAKPKSEKQEQTSAVSATEAEKPSESEDVVMGDNESEEEREDLFLDTGARNTGKAQQSRKDREEQLKQMMEVDEEMPDAEEEVEKAPENAPVTDEPPAAEEPAAEPEVPEATEVTAASEAPPGTRRRRGRRQVMKKKTTRDEEGYLITRNEPEWESFSEDEAPAPPQRKPAASTASKPGKAGGGKAGQGNIMSFFGKK